MQLLECVRVDRRKRLSHVGAQGLVPWWGRRFRLPTDSFLPLEGAVSPMKILRSQTVRLFDTGRFSDVRIPAQLARGHPEPSQPPRLHRWQPTCYPTFSSYLQVCNTKRNS